MGNEAFDKLKFCGDDDISLSQRFSQKSLRTCITKCDDYVKKRNTTLPVKRLLNQTDSLLISVKKSKVSPYHDHNEDGDEDDILLSDLIKRPGKSTHKSFSSLKKDLAMLEKLFEECKRKVQVDEKRFQSLKRDIGHCKRKRKVEEKRLQSIKRYVEECCKELENKKTQVSCVRRIDEAHEKMQGKIEECIKDFVVKEGKLYLMDDLIGERKQELKTKEIELNQVNGNISKEKQYKKRVKELESREKHLEGRVKDLESREKQLEGQEKEFEDQLKMLMNELVSKKMLFERQLKNLETKEKQFEEQKKEFQSKQEEFKGQVEELESNEEEFKGRVKELSLKKKQFERQVESFESKEKQFEGRWKELELKENKFKVQVKEFKLKEKQFGGQVKDPKLKLKKFDLRPTKLGSRKKYIEETQSVASLMDYQLSHTTGETSLQLDTTKKTDEVVSLYNDILANLLDSSDPSRLVLDMIQNPTIQLCKKGDNAVIIADYHIYSLEQLMKISPHIKPCVREEALKLAFDLKSNMSENTKNSLVVLGFLLLLSIYGLVTSFGEDEVLELFASVAQHKIAIELFETLGFANKVSGFVKNLIRKKQFVGAVRFSYAYNLADNNQLVDLLREFVQNAKLICESSCKKINSIEIKDKARDQEIANLGTALLCISECNLESEVLLIKEIDYRILELKGHKGN
ncbi:frigida-LIKE protein [Medicago truncatula]|nr:frigida-LIKE protein [Medicago truncatula]